MDGETLTWIFLIGGILLIATEWLIPSGVAVVFGFSGLLVGAIRFFGLLEDPVTATLAWVVASALLAVVTLPFMKKYFGGETSSKFADEDYEAMDQVVDVIEPIDEYTNEGRVRFQGISWQARSLDGDIPTGTQVRIKYRDNTTWIVEPVNQIDSQTSERIKQ